MASKEGLSGFFLVYTLAEYFTAFFHSAGVKKQGWKGEIFMKSKEELSLKVTKEIVVKFIEMGGVSVNSFEGVWKKVHGTVSDSIKETALEK